MIPYPLSYIWILDPSALTIAPSNPSAYAFVTYSYAPKLFVAVSTRTSLAVDGTYSC